MAQPADPFENLVADGYIITRPDTHHDTAKVHFIDLDVLTANLILKMSSIYGYHPRVRQCYSGSPNQIAQLIESDITMLANYMAASLYNKLRATLERASPSARAVYMNPRAPVHNATEYPSWISATLSSIGPFREMHGPIDTYVVYATETARANNYGRAEAHALTHGPYDRFMFALRSIGITMAPLDFQGMNGSAFPTIIFEPNNDQTWNALGTVHPTLYENEDIPRALLCCSALGHTPFPNVGITAGYVDDNATLTALAAVDAPAGIPAGQVATSAGRPVGSNWDVNYYGIRPAVVATATTDARSRGIYIIGRGTTRYFTHKRAIDLPNTSVLEVLRFRLLRTT